MDELLHAIVDATKRGWAVEFVNAPSLPAIMIRGKKEHKGQLWINERAIARSQFVHLRDPSGAVASDIRIATDDKQLPQ